jgi:hypothetical protein
MLLMNPIRQALESIVPPFERIINESPQLLSQESSSTPSLPTTLLMAMLLDQLMSPLRRIMPVTALTLLYEEYSPYEIVSLLLHSTKLSIIESKYIKDKSSAEVLFYIAILLAILLFLIVIPICEVLLFGTDSTIDEQQLEHDIKSYYQHSVGYNTNNNSRLIERSDTLFDDQEYYWDNEDDDDEVELNDLALTLSRSSSNTSFSRGGSVGSGSSANSHGSSTMETIEESGEEDANDDEDDNDVDEDQEVLLVKGGSSSTSSCTDDSCPDLNETMDDYDDEDEVFNSNDTTEYKDQVNYLFFGYTRSSRE